LGGSDLDQGNGIAVDGAGAIYTVGAFNDTADFDPGPGVFNLTSAGSSDAFVSKLDSAGNLIWALQLGGSNGDYGAGIALTSAGNAYVIGSTASTYFPTAGAFQTTNAGSNEVFVAEVRTNPTADAGGPYTLPE